MLKLQRSDIDYVRRPWSYVKIKKHEKYIMKYKNLYFILHGFMTYIF